VPFWKIAEHMGVCEMTITRRLRGVLTDEQRQEFFDVIAKLAGGTP